MDIMEINFLENTLIANSEFSKNSLEKSDPIVMRKKWLLNFMFKQHAINQVDYKCSQVIQFPRNLVW